MALPWCSRFGLCHGASIGALQNRRSTQPGTPSPAFRPLRPLPGSPAPPQARRWPPEAPAGAVVTLRLGSAACASGSLSCAVANAIQYVVKFRVDLKTICKSVSPATNGLSTYEAKFNAALSRSGRAPTATSLHLHSAQHATRASMAGGVAPLALGSGRGTCVLIGTSD